MILLLSNIVFLIIHIVSFMLDTHCMSVLYIYLKTWHENDTYNISLISLSVHSMHLRWGHSSEALLWITEPEKARFHHWPPDWSISAITPQLTSQSETYDESMARLNLGMCSHIPIRLKLKEVVAMMLWLKWPLTLRQTTPVQQLCINKERVHWQKQIFNTNAHKKRAHITVIVNKNCTFDALLLQTQSISMISGNHKWSSESCFGSCWLMFVQKKW